MASSSKVGKVHLVFCKNFVTYNEISFKPTEYLNIIIGPNGTGKSTLVAAIVIGLGGEPKILSRSSAIQDFIKNGKNEAKVIVKLYADERGGGLATFQRRFNREGKSEFQVNNAIVTKDKFLKAVAAYNVQIKNLCQFLPQDRVQDFAKMNAQDVFANTLKSVCGPAVLENFQKLKELRAEQSNGEDDIGKAIQKLNDLMNHVESLKHIVERFQARQEIAEKITICKAKKLWISARKFCDKFFHSQTLFNKSAFKIKVQIEISKRFEKDVQAERNVGIALKNAAEEKKINLNRIWSKQQNVAKDTTAAIQKIQTLKNEFKRQKKEFQYSQSELEGNKILLESKLEELKTAEEAVGTDPSAVITEKQKYRREAEELWIERKRLVTELCNLNTTLDEEFISEMRFLENKIERLRNVEQRKIEILKTKYEDVYKAMCWLEENRDSLEGRVYRPIFLEINVIDANHIIKVEDCIKEHDLISFACERQNDVNLLIEELAVKRRLRIGVVHVYPANRVTYFPWTPLSQLKIYGFTHYMIDLLSGPPPILNFLCSVYHIHNIPIGGAQVNQCADKIPAQIHLYFSDDMRFNSNQSVYSRQRSLVQNFLFKKNILGSVDEKELNLLQAQLNKLIESSNTLKNERTVIETKIQEVDSKRKEARQKSLDFEAKLKNFENIKKTIERQTQKLQRIKDNLIDVPKLNDDLDDNLKACVANIISLHQQNVEILQEYQKELIEKELAMQNQTFHSQIINQKTSKYREEKDKIRTLKQDRLSYKREYDYNAKMWKKVLDEAKSLTNNITPGDVNFPYEEQFDVLPDSLEELNEILNEQRARYNCISDTDQEIVTEYEEKRNEVEIIKQNIEEKQRTNGNLESQINEIYADWKHEIDGVVFELNNRFSGFMQSMQFAGEIALSHKNEHDFDSYGINISVQYRKETPLQTLDRCVQSGGERAVAIAVYTLSLQHLSHVPFRCVDEINQGMDPKNERKIFEMLVDETTKTGSSQYFFVTPKLLPNLKTHERMTIHIVFNGKLLERNINFG